MPNTSADSLGINQRAHDSIDQFASATAVPYSRIRPAIFSASLLAAAPEVHAAHRPPPRPVAEFLHEHHTEFV